MKKIKRLIAWKALCGVCKFREVIISDDNDCTPYASVWCSKFMFLTVEANPDNCPIWKQLETDENEGPPEK